MIRLEKVRSMSIDELATFIDKYGMYDNTPWMNWWDKNYCDKCESIKLNYEESQKILQIVPFFKDSTVECAYCEVHGKCRYFPDIEETPSMKDIVKMWLSSEEEHEEF